MKRGSMTLFQPFKSLSTIRLSACIAIIYAFAAYGSLQLSFAGTNASPVWPPSGIAFTAIWFLGYRVWPGIWLGAFIANLLVFNHLGWAVLPALSVSALIGVGNSIEAVLAVMFLRSFIPAQYHLSKISDIFKFLFAVLLACVSSASMGTAAVYFIHPAQGINFDMIWFTWWLGDVVGILVIASIFLTFHEKLWQIRSWQSILEALMVSIILIVVNAGVFLGRFPEYGFYAHVTYLVLPFAIWATYRFAFPGAILSILITSIVAIMGSMLHLGPFVGQRVPDDLVIVECFIGVITVTVLSLAAALYEREVAEEEIKRNEARFRSLVENSFEVIALVDTEAKVIYTSPPTKFVLGDDSFSFLGRSMFEWMHPDDTPAVLEIFQGLLKTPGAIAHATCRMRRNDGSWRWMEGSGHNLLHDPAINAVVINYRDITERKLSQEHFEQVVEFSPVANIMVDKDGNIQLVNKTTEALFGYSREELLQMKIESLVPEEFLHEPKAQPMGIERELYALRKDGKRVPVEIGLTPIQTEEGLCILISMVDITQRKKAEEILKRDKESLEQLVDERSKELIKTQKELKQFSRLADIGTLAATVAHELRNPLGVIHLAAYNLKREKKELGDNRHLANIEKKVWEGNQIIDNLLSYARIRIPNYEHMQILPILDECVTSVQGRFGEMGVVIEKKYEADLDFMDADPNQIREIFMNILNNACQACTSPGPLVELRTQHEDDMIKVSVKDNGTGIAAEDLDKVFEPFFTRKSKGTGLGLTICNELVNMYQGRIDIQSQVGEGTTFSVFLPIKRKNDADETASH